MKEIKHDDDNALRLSDGLCDMGDLAILVIRLARAVKRLEPNNDLPDKALDYLKKHGLYNILR